jgi:hypothetical protein
MFDDENGMQDMTAWLQHSYKVYADMADCSKSYHGYVNETCIGEGHSKRDIDRK